MYNPRDIIEIIAGNVRSTGNPFGIPKFMVNRWHKGLRLPVQGDAMLFTGLMYQFTPYIDKSTRYLARYEDNPWSRYLRYASVVPGYLSGIGLAMITPRTEKRQSGGILRNIVRILSASNVDFCYRPTLDAYSGVLLYDLGDQEGFETHARRVAGKLEAAGIRKLITVDPHTTYALKVLFPKYTGVSFEVKTYFELVDFVSGNGRRRVTLHDPCFYGRYLELSDVPQRVLNSLDIQCAPVTHSGRYTNCCGGPAESISPKLSAEVGGRRRGELEATGEKIVAMCPICLGNLKKCGADVQDLSEVIAGCIGS